MIFDTGSRENLVSIAHPVIEGERLIKNEFPRKFSGAFSPQATTSSHHVFLDLDTEEGPTNPVKERTIPGYRPTN